MKTEKLEQVNWAGQICDVLEETQSALKIRFTNASGTCVMWISRSAKLYKVNE